MTGADALLHVEARLTDRTVRLSISAPDRPDVNLDMDVDAVRELAGALLDALTALGSPGKA